LQNLPSTSPAAPISLHSEMYSITPSDVLKLLAILEQLAGYSNRLTRGWA